MEPRINQDLGLDLAPDWVPSQAGRLEREEREERAAALEQEVRAGAVPGGVDCREQLEQERVRVERSQRGPGGELEQGRLEEELDQLEREERMGRVLVLDCGS